MRDAEIAVVHGNFFTRGGGESVAAELARTFDAPLYYGFGYEEKVPDDVECISLFNGHTFANTIKERDLLRNFYYLRQSQCVPDLYEYDVLIQSGNELGWYLPPDDQVVVKYTHSTPRDAYDCFPKQAPQRGWLYEFTSFLTQLLYQRNLPYPDLYVANSEVIARRLDRYWDKNGDDVMIVYPPVKVATFGQEYADETPIEEEYYIVLDRLVKRKHIGEIINAFAEQPQLQLVIAGSGPREPYLRKQAADLDNVRFRGHVSEAEKQPLLAGANALIYAAEEEDFGIVPIEALASGTPVIGPREGFTQYQIQDGITGVLYDRGPDAIEDAVTRFESDGIAASSAALERVAEQFSVERFRNEMREVVEVARRRAHITPKLIQVDTTDFGFDRQITVSDGGDTK